MKFTQRLLATIIAVGFGFASSAQTGSTPTTGATNVSFNIDDLLKVGVDDANTYFENYIGNTMGAVTNGLGSGWYNTAKPHKLLGFDLTATLNFVSIPKAEQTFKYNAANFKNLKVVDASGNAIPDGTEMPTLLGGNNESNADYKLAIKAGATVKDPSGNKFVYDKDVVLGKAPSSVVPKEASDALSSVGVPVPMAQLGIGLPKSTDLKVRYGTDAGSVKGLSVNMWGVGVMHDVKQWIPGIKNVPISISAFFGHTSFNLTKDISLDGASNGGISLTDGKASLKASSTTVQAIVSKKFLIVTPYLGVGASFGGSSIKVKGDLKFEQSIAGTPKKAEFKDPIKLNFDGGTTPRINVGLRLQLAVISIHAEYAIQKYNTFTAGLGLSIR